MVMSRDVASLLNGPKSVRALRQYVDRTMDRLLRELAAGISKPGAARATALIARIKEITRQLDPAREGYVRNWIRREIPKAYVLGDRSATRELRAQLEGTGPVVHEGWTAVNQASVKAISNAMENSLSNAATQLRQSATTLIRRTQLTLNQSRSVTEATTSGLIRGATGSEVSDDIARLLLGRKVPADVKNRLRDRGFSADLFDRFEKMARGTVIQVGKKSMSIRQYADLTARTQTREAAKVGTVVRLQQNGVDHVKVSSHVQAEPDECSPFDGCVFFVGAGKDPLGFPPLSGIVNGGPPFHPNCKHAIAGWVASFHTKEQIATELQKSLAIPSVMFHKTGAEVRKLVGAA